MDEEENPNKICILSVEIAHTLFFLQFGVLAITNQ